MKNNLIKNIFIKNKFNYNYNYINLVNFNIKNIIYNNGSNGLWIIYNNKLYNDFLILSAFNYFKDNQNNIVNKKYYYYSLWKYKKISFLMCDSTDLTVLYIILSCGILDQMFSNLYNFTLLPLDPRCNYNIDCFVYFHRELQIDLQTYDPSLEVMYKKWKSRPKLLQELAQSYLGLYTTASILYIIFYIYNELVIFIKK